MYKWWSKFVSNYNNLIIWYKWTPYEKIKVHSTAASTKWTAQICSIIYLQLANIVIKFSLAINTSPKESGKQGSSKPPFS